MRLMWAEGILGGGFGAQSSRDGEQIATAFEEEGGSGTQSPEIRLDTSESPDAKARQRDLAVRLSQATIADAVGLLMRSERHRHYSLADLEWLLLPPMLLNQIILSYVRPQIAKKAPEASVEGQKPIGNLPPMAVAMVTWAMVSAEVDAKLEAQLKAGGQPRLAPTEWRSGSVARIIDTVGQPDAIKGILAQLASKLPQLRNTGR